MWFGVAMAIGNTIAAGIVTRFSERRPWLKGVLRFHAAVANRSSQPRIRLLAQCATRIVFVANYTLSFISMFRLRMKEPEMARPYRAWDYPWTPGLALASSIVFLAGAVYTNRVNTSWALVILAASYPIFRVMKLFSRRASA